MTHVSDPASKPPSAPNRPRPLSVVFGHSLPRTTAIVNRPARQAVARGSGVRIGTPNLFAELNWDRVGNGDQLLSGCL